MATNDITALVTAVGVLITAIGAAVSIVLQAYGNARAKRMEKSVDGLLVARDAASKREGRSDLIAEQGIKEGVEAVAVLKAQVAVLPPSIVDHAALARAEAAKAAPPAAAQAAPPAASQEAPPAAADAAPPAVRAALAEERARDAKTAKDAKIAKDANDEKTP